jgi:hypothetical protein
MATMIVKHRVANFEAWKQVFDSLNETRRQHGWTSHLVVRDASDPNVVTIVSRIKTVDGAKRYGASPDLRTAMQKAGVQGAPEISFAEDDSDHRYE